MKGYLKYLRGNDKGFVLLWMLFLAILALFTAEDHIRFFIFGFFFLIFSGVIAYTIKDYKEYKKNL